MSILKRLAIMGNYPKLRLAPYMIIFTTREGRERPSNHYHIFTDMFIASRGLSVHLRRNRGDTLRGKL